jgi:NADP-dependent 3-hydroxy acid dehydrogenase YdfG
VLPSAGPAGPAGAATGSALVVGVGPAAGLGAALARRFARGGLAVTVAGRSADKLKAVADDLRASGARARALVADATRPTAVQRLLASADAAADLELVVFNVGHNRVAPALELSPAEFEALWRQNALAGFLVGQAAVRQMLARGRGTLIFTGATASLRARPPFIGFAAAKAALRAVAQALAREFAPQGLHVAHVIIDGALDGEYARSQFPAVVRSKGHDGLLQVDDVAEAYWSIHQQPRSAWTHELDLRPFKEPF